MPAGLLDIYIDEVKGVPEEVKKIYYVAHVGAQRYRSDDSKEKNQSASFEDELKFDVPDGVGGILFQVWEDFSLKKDTLLAEGTYPLQQLTGQGSEQANITLKTEGGETFGKLSTRATFQPGKVEFDHDYFKKAFKDPSDQFTKPPKEVGYEDPQKKLSSKDKTAIGIGAGIGGVALAGGIGFGIYEAVQHKKHKDQSRKDQESLGSQSQSGHQGGQGGQQQGGQGGYQQ